MLAIWGDRLVGKVDQVPGVCYVATMFVHIFYFPIFPLFPLRSYIVVEGSYEQLDFHWDLFGWETMHGFRGVRIPISLKSVFLAYVRAILAVFLAMGTGCLSIILQESKHRPIDLNAAIFFAGVILVSGFLFWFTLWASRATPSRASELQRRIGGLLDEV
jgi:hypothetical protein